MGVAAVKVGSGSCGAWDVGNSASYRLAEFQFLLILFHGEDTSAASGLRHLADTLEV